MTYLVRVVLPDRPGTLGAVASALGQEGADILSVDVVERHHGVAVDDLVVDLPPSRPPDVLITAAESVREVTVESVRPFFGPLDTARELELVETIAATPENGLVLLADAVPRIFRSSWSLVVEADDTGRGTGGGVVTGGIRVRRVTASSAAPETEAEALPWLPLPKATVLDPAAGHTVPSAWTDLDTELAAAPLGRPDRALVVGRPGGPAFRPSELARLSHLAGIVATMTG